jgi:hypothetical protein
MLLFVIAGPSRPAARASATTEAQPARLHHGGRAARLRSGPASSGAATGAGEVEPSGAGIISPARRGRQPARRRRPGLGGRASGALSVLASSAGPPPRRGRGRGEVVLVPVRQDGAVPELGPARGGRRRRAPAGHVPPRRRGGARDRAGRRRGGSWPLWSMICSSPSGPLTSASNLEHCAGRAQRPPRAPVSVGAPAQASTVVPSSWPRLARGERAVRVTGSVGGRSGLVARPRRAGVPHRPFDATLPAAPAWPLAGAMPRHLGGRGRETNPAGPDPPPDTFAGAGADAGSGRCPRAHAEIAPPRPRRAGYANSLSRATATAASSRAEYA